MSCADFIAAAVVPRDDHASGTLEVADALLAGGLEMDIYAAAILGDADAASELLVEKPGRATAPGGPNEWDALTYLCFSMYLREQGEQRGFVRVAELLLDAGADANTGYFDTEHMPESTFESALYGAAGVAHHAGLTRLLLAHGADPNLGGEVAYHSPEWFNDEAMHAVVESGRLDRAGLTTMLHRKLDWTGLEGVRWLLEHGADPNDDSDWGDRALHHALDRGNALPLIEALIEHGADPTLVRRRPPERTAVALAARLGRADALDLFARAGFDISLDGDDAFFAALTRADRTAALELLRPGLVARLESEQPGVVTALAGAGNTAAVALALELGFPLSGDALSVAVWRERAGTVRLLLERGAPVTPEVVELAERALTEMSDWTPHHSQEIVDALKNS